MDAASLWPESLFTFATLLQNGVDIRDVDAMMVACDELEEQNIPGAEQLREEYRQRKEHKQKCLYGEWKWTV